MDGGIYPYTYTNLSLNENFIINSKIPEVNCLCPLCENVELLCKGVNKHTDLELPVKCHDLMEKIGCNPLREDCSNGTCGECPKIDLEMLQDVDKIPFYYWVKKEYYHKELTELSGPEVKDRLCELFTVLKSHFFRKRVQSQMYKKHLDELKDNEMLIHVDYSENYKNKQQDEIKSAFYGQGQFTIYTACIYVKHEGKNVCKWMFS